IRAPAARIVEAERNLGASRGGRHGVDGIPGQDAPLTPVGAVRQQSLALAVDLETHMCRVAVDQLRGVSTRRSGDGEHGDGGDPPKVHPPAESVPDAPPATPRSSDAKRPARY